MFVALLELGSGKLLVFLNIQWLQVHQRYVYMGAGDVKHSRHQMAMRAREDEVVLAYLPYNSNEQCLYAIVGIVGDL